MGWVQIYKTGYNRNSISESYARYENTSSNAKYITAFTVRLGVGANGTTYTAGDTVTGNGAAISVTMSCGNATATRSVSKTVGRTYSSSVGYYPTFSSCDTYTFVFSEPIKVAAGGSKTISITTTNGSSVFVCDYDSGVTNHEELQGTVWINTDGTSSGWQRAIPWVNNDGTSNGWKMCGG